MKKTLLILLSAISSCYLSAQGIITLFPQADVTIGFHDGENSADVNGNDSPHFSSFWQPAWTGINENGGWALMKFDLSGIPIGSEIISADLSLIAFGDDFSPFISEGHMSSNACWLSRVSESWDELDVTWNTQPNITEVGQISVAASIDPYEDYIIDIKSFIQDMLDNPAANHGFALRLQDESPTRGLMFHSSNSAIEAEWPSLTITYDDGTGINDQEDKNDVIYIFPNPTLNIVEITFQNMVNETYRISIYNINGELVINKVTNEKSPKISLEKLPSGIYNIVIVNTTNNSAISEKVIKK